MVKARSGSRSKHHDPLRDVLGDMSISVCLVSERFGPYEVSTLARQERGSC